VGEALAMEGCLERYAVDFIGRRINWVWNVQVI
jgi:hypothetical protein